MRTMPSKKSSALLIMTIFLAIVIFVIGSTGQFSPPETNLEKRFPARDTPLDELTAFQSAESGLWGYVDAEGSVVVSPKFYMLQDNLKGAIGFAESRDGSFGYIDRNGSWAINPTFDSAMEFSFGFAAVMRNGKWGFIDQSGAIVEPLLWDAALNVDVDGRAFVGTQSIYSKLETQIADVGERYHWQIFVVDGE